MATGSKASSDAIKAGEAFVELVTDDTQFTESLKRASARFIKYVELIKTAGVGQIIRSLGVKGIVEGFGVGVQKIGGLLKDIGKSGALLGSAIVVPFAVASYSALKYIDSIQDIADRAGTTTEAVSRLAYAAKLSATSIEDVEAANKILTKATIAAKDGAEDQATAFRVLGIEADDFLELDIDERFALIGQAVDDLASPLDRSRLLFALFGKSATTLVPLFADGADGLRKLYDEAEKVGAVIRTEDGKKAAAAMDAFDMVLTSVKSTLIEVGLAVFSMGGDLKEGQRIVLMYLKMAREWIKENKVLVAGIVVVAAAVAAAGVALVGLGVVVGSIGALISGGAVIVGILGAVLGALTIKFVLVAAAIAALTVGLGYLIYRFFKFTELGKDIGNRFANLFGKIGESFSLMWNGIVGALKKGDFETAFRIVQVGTLRIWTQLVTWMKEGWHDFTNFFINGWMDAVTLLRANFEKFVNFIKVTGLGVVRTLVEELAKAFDKVNVFGQFDKEIASLKKASGELDKIIASLLNEKFIVQRQILDEGEAFKKAREKDQRAEIKEGEDEIKRLTRLLKTLNEKANEPIVEVPRLPVAPMPHIPGKLDSQMGTLGDSVRGLFDSADFRGALALGEKNEYAKQAADGIKEIIGELKVLNTKVGNNVFV